MLKLSHTIKRLLPLCLAALLLAGCGSGAGPEGGDPDLEQIKTNLGPIATYLDLDALSDAALSESYQTIGREGKDGGAVLQVTEAAGDGTILHVAFTLTYPKGREDLPSPKDISLVQGASADEGYIGASPSAFQSQESGSGSYDCLATFSYDREVLQAGDTLTLTVKSSLDDSFSCSVTWTQEKLGSIRYVDLTDDAGRMVGTALLSPFSLKISLWDTRGVSPEDLQNSISLLDGNGEALEVLGVFTTESGTFFTGEFYAPVDLSQVASIHIGLFTTPLTQTAAEPQPAQP